MSCINICNYPYKAFQYAVEGSTSSYTANLDELKTGIDMVCNYVATNTFSNSNPFQYFNSFGCMVDFPDRVQRIISLNLSLEGVAMDRIFDSLMDCFSPELLNRLINTSYNIKNWCLAFEIMPNSSLNTVELESIKKYLSELLINNSVVVYRGIKDVWINATTGLVFVAACYIIARELN